MIYIAPKQYVTKGAFKQAVQFDLSDFFLYDCATYRGLSDSISHILSRKPRITVVSMKRKWVAEVTRDKKSGKVRVI